MGKKGKILDRLLDYIKLTKDQIYVTNVVKVRPENNRTPTDEEINSWKYPLYDELRHFEDVPILALGNCAAKAFLGIGISIGKARGQFWSIKLNNKVVTLIPTYHPAYLLRNPSAEECVKKDITLIKQLIKYKD